MYTLKQADGRWRRAGCISQYLGCISQYLDWRSALIVLIKRKFGSLDRVLAALVGAFAISMMTATAHAVPLNDFGCITNNSAGDCAIGEDQISATLTEGAAGEATLEITMTGTDAAVIEQLFLDSTLLTGASFTSSGGIGIVEFTDDSSAGNLPGGNTVAFSTDESSSADPPPTKNGIGYHNNDQTSGQSGSFLLEYGGTFDELVASLTVGVHVIGFDSGGSESFTTGGGPPVPEPTAALVFAIGFGVVSAARRRSD